MNQVSYSVMTKKQAQNDSSRIDTNSSLPKINKDSSHEILDDNTSLDLIVSPLGYVTELTDTVDSMDGAKTEVIDIINEADGTNIELTIIEEPTETPGVDSVDRFVEIKGIGPKVASLLKEAGIQQFSELAETPIERLREILASAGNHYRIYDPTNWPQQAKQLASRDSSMFTSAVSPKA